MNEWADALLPLVNCFEKAGVSYYISGSIASTAHGSARSTLDVDLVADLKLSQIDSLYESLKSTYYLSAEAAKEAVNNQSSFNLIHLDTMIKIDVFVLKNDPFEKAALLRKKKGDFSEDPPIAFYISSAEDIVLSKLKWYKQGGEVSQQQWHDIQGVLKVQKDQLDMIYLKEWAKRLDLTKLLEQSLQDAGIQL